MNFLKRKLHKKYLFAVLVLVLMVVTTVVPFKVHALTLTPIRLEIAGNPGQTLSEEMTLINEKKTPATYYVSYANFEAQGESGSPTFTEPKDDVGTWITAPSDIIDLAPGQSKIFQIKITIPKNAEPGGHFGAIFWGTTPKANGSGALAIGAKTGMLVLLRVNGNVNEKGGLLEFATKDKQKFFTALPVSFYYRFQNAGGDRIKPTGTIKMKDMIGLTGATIDGNPVEGNVLPGSVRRIEATWQGKDGPTPKDPKDQGNFFNKVGYEWRNFAFGHYKAKMSLAYGTKNEIATASYGFWVFPWHLTLFSIVAFLLIFFITRKGLRKYNRWVIKKAEVMLRNERDAQANDTKNS